MESWTRFYDHSLKCIRFNSTYRSPICLPGKRIPWYRSCSRNRWSWRTLFRKLCLLQRHRELSDHTRLAWRYHGFFRCRPSRWYWVRNWWFCDRSNILANGKECNLSVGLGPTKPMCTFLEAFTLSLKVINLHFLYIEDSKEAFSHNSCVLRALCTHFFRSSWSILSSRA